MNMKTTVKHSLFVLLTAMMPMGAIHAATLVWSEDFDLLVPTDTITTSNTNFDRVNERSDLGGSITLIASTVESGSSMRLTGATSSDSGAFVGAGGIGTMTVMSVGFSVKMESLESGILGFYMGNGNTVAGNFGNNSRNSTHFLWDVAVQASTGKLQYMNSLGVYQDTGFVLQEGTAYEFLIQVNAEGTEVDGVAASSMNIYVDGGVQASGLELRGGTANANGFRMGGRSASTDGLIGEIDNIRIWNGIQAVPEPSVAGLLLGSAVCLMMQRRRKMAARECGMIRTTDAAFTIQCDLR